MAGQEGPKDPSATFRWGEHRGKRILFGNSKATEENPAYPNQPTKAPRGNGMQPELEYDDMFETASVDVTGFVPSEKHPPPPPMESGKDDEMPPPEGYTGGMSTHMGALRLEERAEYEAYWAHKMSLGTKLLIYGATTACVSAALGIHNLGKRLLKDPQGMLETELEPDMFQSSIEEDSEDAEDEESIPEEEADED